MLLDVLADIGGIFDIMLFLGMMLFVCCKTRFYKGYVREIYFPQTLDREFLEIMNIKKEKELDKQI